MSHSLLAPSQSHRWLKCIASLVEESVFPDTESLEAAEGTLAHSLAAAYLETDLDIRENDGSYPDSLEWEGQSISTEMMLNVQTYLDSVRGFTQPEAEMWVEKKLDISAVYGVPGQEGTGDCITFTDEYIHGHDYKNGKGVRVVAKDNTQLIIYILAAIAEIGKRFKDIKLIIHQPRFNTEPDVWIITHDELMKKAAQINKVAQAAYKLYNTYREGVELLCSEEDALESFRKEYAAEYNPGEKQCRWCKAKALCPALTSFVEKTLDSEFEDFTETQVEAVKDVSEDRLSLIYSRLDLIVAWVSEMRKRAKMLADTGVKIIGQKLVRGRKSSRKWTDPDEVEQILKKMKFKKDEMYDFKLTSPPKLEKVCKATKRQRRWGKLQSYIIAQEGGTVLVSEDDPREEIKIESIEDAFEDLTKEDKCD